MASAVLVGVNPVYGLYASMAGPIGGGLTVSTRLLVVTTTTAAALAAGSALSGFSGGDRSEALFVLSALAGVMMIAAGLLRLGRYTRFVSVSVLTGFLTGVAVNIILGQLGDLLGSPQTGGPSLVKAWNVVTHPSDMSLTAAVVGISALLLMIVLSRTKIASVASVIALVVPTLLSLGASSLVRVEDSGQIPTGIPTCASMRPRPMPSRSKMCASAGGYPQIGFNQSGRGSHSIAAVACGEMVVHPRATGSPREPVSFTPAEMRILPWLATYLTLGGIAERLGVRRSTVKTHVVSIYKKLGVSNRTAAIQRAEAGGLLPDLTPAAGRSIGRSDASDDPGRPNAPPTSR